MSASYNQIYSRVLLTTRLASIVNITAVTLALCLAEAVAQSGVSVWTNRFQRQSGFSEDLSRALVVDGSGNVIVTGESWDGTSDDYATIKYSNAGIPLWTNFYRGSVNGSDNAKAVGVDSSGNVFVTGYSQGSSGDFATIAYSSMGVPLWTNRYNGGGKAMAVDIRGNVIVAGESYGGSSSWGDCATIKYFNGGTPMWTNRYNGTANRYEFPYAIGANANGDVFVTGYSQGAGNISDYFTIGYSSGGVPLWTNRYGSAIGMDSAVALAVDRDGNVIITGHSTGSGGFSDFGTIAYSITGVPLWTNLYDFGGEDSATAVAVDGSGNAFVTGYSDRSGNYDYDFATVAYSSNGAALWTNRYSNGLANSRANAIAVDNMENVIVTGVSTGTDGSMDYTTIAYSNAGIPLWTNFYSGNNGTDWASGVAIDGSNSVFVTGYSAVNSGTIYVTIKYSNVSSLPIPLAFQIVGTEIVLSWTNAAFNLQTSSTVDGVYTTISGATSPYSNTLSGDQQFFRLKGN